MLFAGSASATDKYQYTASIQPASNTGTASGNVSVKGLDSSKTVTFRVIRGGIQQLAVSYASGNTSINFNFAGLQAGDQVETQQPSGTVQDTFTVPDVSLTGTAGSAVVSGHAPDGSVSYVSYTSPCWGWNNDDLRVTPSGGAFSVALPGALLAGGSLYVTSDPGKGDQVRFSDRLPGESPCISASTYLYPMRLGQTPNPEPFSIDISRLHATTATGARIVLRRAGAALVDYSDPSATGSVYKTFGVQPLPGDTIELYRPHTAPAPSATFTIPAISSVYDASNSLVAVDAPAAGFLQLYAGSLYQMFENSRGAVNTGAGRTILNFGASQGYEPAFDLSAADFVAGSWFAPNDLAAVDFGSHRGDLTPPVLKLKLASKFKLNKLGGSIPVSVSSTEVATANMKLTLPAKLKTSASGKARKPVVIASAKGTLKVGAKKFNLKLTKTGKKLLKKIRRLGLPAQTATLTVTATDPSGNASTKTKTAKLAPK